MNTIQQLQAPFSPDDIEWRVQRESRDGSSVLVLAYVTNRAIQARFDEVFGPFGWQNSFHEGPQGGLICKLGAYDTNSKQWVWKEDGAENTQVEAVKGGLSSAMKRTAVQWGVGRYLYNLTDAWAKLQDSKPNPNQQKQQPGFHKGRSWATPCLPERALPRGVEPASQANTEAGNLTEGMKKTFWNHCKAHFTDPKRCREVYSDAFARFGAGDNMPMAHYQTACKWVIEISDKEKQSPLKKE